MFSRKSLSRSPTKWSDRYDGPVYRFAHSSSSVCIKITAADPLLNISLNMPLSAIRDNPTQLQDLSHLKLCPEIPTFGAIVSFYSIVILN